MYNSRYVEPDYKGMVNIARERPAVVLESLLLVHRRHMGASVLGLRTYGTPL